MQVMDPVNFHIQCVDPFAMIYCMWWYAMGQWPVDVSIRSNGARVLAVYSDVGCRIKYKSARCLESTTK
jgi:hypothetical protein